MPRSILPPIFYPGTRVRIGVKCTNRFCLDCDFLQSAQGGKRCTLFNRELELSRDLQGDGRWWRRCAACLQQGAEVRDGGTYVEVERTGTRPWELNEPQDQLASKRVLGVTRVTSGLPCPDCGRDLAKITRDDPQIRSIYYRLECENLGCNFQVGEYRSYQEVLTALQMIAFDRVRESQDTNPQLEVNPVVVDKPSRTAARTVAPLYLDLQEDEEEET